MLIKSITFRNFRSFKEETTIELNKLSIFVGENNVGKSNIASALKKLKKVLENNRNWEPIPGGAEISIFRESDWNYEAKEEEILIKLVLKLNEQEVTEMNRKFLKCFLNEGVPESQIQSRINNSGDAELIFESKFDHNMMLPIVKYANLYFQNTNCSEDYGKLKLSGGGGQVLRDNIRGIQTNELARRKAAVNYIGYISHMSPNKTLVLQQDIIRKNIVELFCEKIRIFEETRVQDPTTTTNVTESLDGRNLASALLNLKNHREIRLLNRYRKIKEYFESIFDGLEMNAINNHNTPDILISKTDSEDHGHSISQSGSGIFEFLVHITTLMNSKDKIFLFDEPELHLHPSAQITLFNLIKEVSTTNQSMIITHSPYFIDSCNLQDLRTTKHHSTTKVYKIEEELTNEDKSKLHKELSFCNKEIFFAKLVLLIEGATEYGAIPIFSENQKLNFAEKNIFPCSVGGIGNMGLYKKVLDAFKIPYLIVYDFGDGTRIPEVVSTHDKSKTIVLNPDFEGVLQKNGFEKLMEEAKHTHKHSKPRQGSYVAENIPKEQMPEEFKEIVLKCKKELNLP